MTSHNTYRLGFLLSWTWGVSSRLLQQSAATAPYLGRVTPPDLERGVAPLVATPDLRRGVALLVHRL